MASSGLQKHETAVSKLTKRGDLWARSSGALKGRGAAISTWRGWMDDIFLSLHDRLASGSRFFFCLENR